MGQDAESLYRVRSVRSCILRSIVNNTTQRPGDPSRRTKVLPFRALINCFCWHDVPGSLDCEHDESMEHSSTGVFQIFPCKQVGQTDIIPPAFGVRDLGCYQSPRRQCKRNYSSYYPHSSHKENCWTLHVETSQGRCHRWQSDWDQFSDCFLPYILARPLR